MITPNSRIIILKSPMELDDKNQITFASATAQYNYFYGLTKKELDNATFVRKDNVIRFETDEDFTYDDVLLYNYCMYQNTSYGSKWFYAYITGVTYKSDGMSELTIKTDVYQTWCFEALWRESFIEREHLAKADDIVGANLIPENLETGDYVVDGSEAINIYGNSVNDYQVILGVTKYPGTTATPGQNVGGMIYGGVYSGLAYITGEDYAGVENIIRSYNDVGGINSIVTMFLIPKELGTPVSWTTVAGWSYNVKYGTIPSDSGTWGASFQTVTKPTTLNSYTPINKKLLTFPYVYLNLDNNVGNAISYYYEDFTDNTIIFDVEGTIVPGGSYKLSPHNYKNVTTNNLYSLTPAKLPICAWQSDIYTNWLTQNAVNIPIQIGGGIISTIAGAATGNAIGVAAGISSIAQSIGQIYEHSLIPPSINGNINGGDVAFASGLSNPILYKMSIKSQFARVIDDYFSMYGYATHRVKLPNLSNRSNWNYIKTINANIIGAVPQEDLSEFRKLFDDGITLWHTTTDFLDYSKANN